MFLEPSRPRFSHRARPALLTTEPRRGRLRVRVHAVDAPPLPPPPEQPAVAEEPPAPEEPSTPRPELVLPMPRVALLAAALALAVTSRGDVVVLALLLGFGAGRRTSGLASGAALAAALVRWGSPALGAIAGAQAVLGPAGWTGSSFAVASAWLAAVALVLAAVSIDKTSPVVTALSVAPFAIAAADVVVGPARGGALALRVLASVLALVVATVLARWRSRPWIAAGAGALALLCAGIAR